MIGSNVLEVIGLRNVFWNIRVLTRLRIYQVLALIFRVKRLSQVQTCIAKRLSQVQPTLYCKETVPSVNLYCKETAPSVNLIA